MNYSDRNNGALPSNTFPKLTIEQKNDYHLIMRYTHCAPLERGDWTHHDSIDIALLRSAGFWTCRVLLTLKISIALAIHSFDPLDRGKENDDVNRKSAVYHI